MSEEEGAEDGDEEEEEEEDEEEVPSKKQALIFCVTEDFCVNTNNRNSRTGEERDQLY
jgi:hypothetical protein